MPNQGKQRKGSLPIGQQATSSFEDPVSILMACHERVRHFARLATRIGEHVTTSGADAEAAQAAAGVLRYFNVAAPLHYADEEVDLYPALRGLGKRVLNNAIQALEDDHAALDALWAEVAPWLEAVVRHESLPVPARLAEFATHHVRHADREELDIYGAIRSLPAPLLADIGERMRARRGG